MVIENVTSRSHIESMLNTLRSVQAQAEAGVNPTWTQIPAADALDQPDFAQMVKQGLSQMGTMQANAQSSQAAYEKGEDMPLSSVVLDMQKASLSFEATLQIRNKVLKAYEDIITMPV